MNVQTLCLSNRHSPTSYSKQSQSQIYFFHPISSLRRWSNLFIVSMCDIYTKKNKKTLLIIDHHSPKTSITGSQRQPRTHGDRRWDANFCPSAGRQCGSIHEMWTCSFQGVQMPDCRTLLRQTLSFVTEHLTPTKLVMKG